MGEEKWLRRKPGRASGTVVPPPVGDDPPPLPERRSPGRTRHRPDGLPRARTEPSVPPVPPVPPVAPVPEMPDNVRLLFKPVLRPSEGGPGKERNREPNFTPIRSPNGNEGLDLPSRPVHGPAVRVWPAGRGEGAAPVGSTVAAQWPSSGGWPGEPGASASVATAGSSVAAGSRPSRGGGPYTWVADYALIEPVASRGVSHRRRGPRRRTAAGPGYRRYLAWMGALTVLLLLTAAGTTVALLGQHAGGKPAAGGGSGGTALAGASRTAAARWVSREISRSAMIGCDTVMCDALIKSGVPSADLLVITPSSQDPLGADVVIATPTLQAQFGSRLSTEYAPSVLASFGTGNAKVTVRVIATYGASAYQLALNRDLAARELLGTQLVGNGRITLPIGAETELASGQVDPRLLITLPALAQRHPIRVLAFYDRAPGASSGVPLSGVMLAGWDPRAGLPAHAYLGWLVNFLRSQRSVYRATDIATTWRQGSAIVSVRFARPYPIGLLH